MGSTDSLCGALRGTAPRRVLGFLFFLFIIICPCVVLVCWLLQFCVFVCFGFAECLETFRSYEMDPFVETARTPLVDFTKGFSL